MVDNSKLVLLILKDSHCTLLALDYVFHFTTFILSAFNPIFYSLIETEKTPHKTQQLQRFFSASIGSITDVGW